MIAPFNGHNEQCTSVLAKVAAAREDIGQAFQEARQAAAQRIAGILLDADAEATPAIIRAVQETGTDIHPELLQGVVLALIERARRQQAAACSATGQVGHAQHVAAPVAEVAA